MANQPVARDTMDLASVKTVNDAAMYSKAIIDDMEEVADQAHTSLTGILEDALEAHTWAGEAKESAENASEYAARALGNLSTVQSVTETLNWITAHGTMTNTQDLTPPETALDPTHVYFVRDNNGDYEVGNYRYSVVTEPDVADISTYYVLSIDESLNNYVGTHVAMTEDGLSVIGLANGWRVLVSSGSGTYIPGVFLIDPNGDIAQATTTNGITHDENKPFYVGSNDAFLNFDGNGHISIGGAVTFGSKTLTTLLSELESAEETTYKTSTMTYENGVLTMGSSNGMKITLGNLGSDDMPRLSFWQGESEVAYITGNQLYIPYSVVLNAMDVGPWRWRKQDNGNLTLQYIG